MKAVTRSEHKRKKLIICVLQHIRTLEDLGGIAKRIEEVRTQEATAGRKSVKYT